MQLKLSQLKKGQQAIILAINSSELEIALMKYGVIRGDLFTLSDQAPLRGPLALEINGNKVAIRRRDAEHIWVKLTT